MKKHYGEKNWTQVMPVKFWFVHSYLITTVIISENIVIFFGEGFYA